MAQTENDGHKWMKDRINNFCSWRCFEMYEEKREKQYAYQLALTYLRPAIPYENYLSIRQPFTPRRKVPDPIAEEAFAILRQKRQKDEVVKAPPIPLGLYFSLLKKEIQTPSSTS
jgi:hypothetical protein